jgi:hypothetical protein
MEPRVGVAVIIFNKDRKVLLGKRKGSLGSGNLSTIDVTLKGLGQFQGDTWSSERVGKSAPFEKRWKKLD